MLEIICLIWLWRVNGKHAIERGQNPKKYRALTLGLWFGLEFTGTFVGAWLMQLLNAGDNAFYGAYFFGDYLRMPAVKADPGTDLWLHCIPGTGYADRA